MVKNACPGTEWLSAKVMFGLGPVSYLVETIDEQLWRRCVDHNKKSTIESRKSLISDYYWEPGNVKRQEIRMKSLLIKKTLKYICN